MIWGKESKAPISKKNGWEAKVHKHNSLFARSNLTRFLFMFRFSRRCPAWPRPAGARAAWTRTGWITPTGCRPDPWGRGSWASPWRGRTDSSTRSPRRSTWSGGGRWCRPRWLVRWTTTTSCRRRHRRPRRRRRTRASRRSSGRGRRSGEFEVTAQ